jgi:hypothetical protein
MFLRKKTLWVGIQGVRPGRPGRLLAVDADSGRVRATFRLPFDPLRVVGGFGSLWITGQGGSRRYGGVLRIDPRSGRVVRVVRGSRALGTALATSAHAVWVGGPDIFPPGHPEKAGVYFVYKIEPRRGQVVRRFRLRSTVIDLVGDGEAVWISGWYGIVKLSESGRVLVRQPIVGSGWSISRAHDGVWVTHTFYGSRRDRRPPAARELLRIRETSKPRFTRVPLSGSPWQVSATAGGAWVALGGYSHEVQWIRDAEPTPDPTRVAIRGVVRGIQATPDGVWVAQLAPNQLSKVC